MERRVRDAEAELNLPPGFRFHPTDEELVVHYLFPKSSSRRLPAPIIAELDLYKFDPWDLPERALFGRREWYFFTPRGRKYPNGSRPNRAAGSGYWKATGADKPVSASTVVVGIKKALVFYHGMAPKGVKTDWIMHEYRLAGVDRAPKGKPEHRLLLDDWVLCRLYNKKSSAASWEEKTASMVIPPARLMKEEEEEEEEETTFVESMGSVPAGVVGGEECGASESCCFRMTPESEIDDDFGGGFPAVTKEEQEGWVMGLKLEEMQGSTMAAAALTSLLDYSSQDCFFFSSLASLPPPPPRQTGFPRLMYICRRWKCRRPDTPLVAMRRLRRRCREATPPRQRCLHTSPA